MRGTLTTRREGLKTHWRNLSARARLGESFGFIDALVVCFKAGHISRDLALEMLAHRVTADELKEYRRVRGCDPLAVPS
jgi:hypothetical protein